MREFSGFMGVIYGSTEWIMRFSTINIIWFLMNVPITFIILSLYLNNFGIEFFLSLLPLLLFIPALFIPSTIAMFATVRDWVMKKDQSSLTKAFFTYMKSDYKKSFLSGLILMSIWLVWIADFYYFSKNDLLRMIFLIVGVILFVYSINFFSLSVHYQMRIKKLIIHTFFVTVGNPVLFFFVLTSNFVLFYLSATEILFLFPLFTGSLSAYLCFAIFYRLTLKMEKKALANNSG
ncbi:YesL family protein [Psychrobacillus sp. L4]|uniref:YesL family protein n=1 Tax=Psychrobacillus sp. L4 TaxID=3236892 RepID=UPI0036F350ED